MTAWQANRNILQERFPALLERLSAPKQPPIDRERIVAIASSGEPTLRIGGVLVHSGREPSREAKKLAELSRGEGPLVILGFGLGYLAEAALALDGERPIIVVERDPDILTLALRERILTLLLSHEKLAFVVGGESEGVIAALEAYGGVPTVAANRALRSIDGEWYDKAEAAVRAWATKNEVNTATLKRFGKRWVRNLAANLNAIRDIPSISILAKCAEGFPALVVSAGPSLDSILPALPAISRRAFIIAVDTALRAVLASGVDPDFVLVVDPQYWNARHLDRCPAPRSILITESAAYPAVLRHTFAHTFLCASLFPLGRFFEDRVDGKGILGAGGSVSTTAWDFARVIGASPIWVAGLDLSYPELKTHFRGALFEERVHAESNRMDPVEQKTFRILRDGNPFRAPDNSGGSVLTDKRLALYASWFEARFRRHPEATPKNLSQKGLHIEGAAFAGLEYLLALPDRRVEIDKTLSDAVAAGRRGFFAEEAHKARSERYIAAHNALSKSLEDLLAISREAAAAANQALAAINGNENAQDIVAKALNTLKKADAAIASSEAKDVAGFLFPSIRELEDAMPREESDAFRRHLTLSKRLYEELASAAKYHHDLL